MKMSKFLRRTMALVLVITMCIGMMGSETFATDGEDYQDTVSEAEVLDNQSEETVQSSQDEEAKEPICGLVEHIHTDECYSTITSDVPVCGFEESEPVEGHTHGSDCYDETGTLLCELEETESTEGHIHSDACYTQTELICGLEEHTHEEGCFAPAENGENGDSTDNEVVSETADSDNQGNPGIDSEDSDDSTAEGETGTDEISEDVIVEDPADDETSGNEATGDGAAEEQSADATEESGDSSAETGGNETTGSEPTNSDPTDDENAGNSDAGEGLIEGDVTQTDEENVDEVEEKGLSEEAQAFLDSLEALKNSMDSSANVEQPAADPGFGFEAPSFEGQMDVTAPTAPVPTTEELLAQVDTLCEMYEALSEEEKQNQQINASYEELTNILNELTAIAAELPEQEVVATVGDAPYATLQEAVSAATEGLPVVLQKDVVESVTIDHSVTLNLNGKTLTGSGGIAVNISTTARVTIEDGSVCGAEGYRAIAATSIKDDVSLTLSSVNVTVGGSLLSEKKSSSNFGGAGVYITKGSLSIENCTFEGDAGKCLNSYGQSSDPYGAHVYIGTNVSSVTITGSTFTGAQSSYGALCFDSKEGTLNITGGSFRNNKSCLRINNSGTANITGTSFTESDQALYVSSGTTTVNDCIIENNTTPSSVNYLINVANNSSKNTVSLTFNGGKISNNDVSGYLIYGSTSYTASLTFDGTEISDNTSTTTLISLSIPDISFNNTTITNNTAQGSGVLRLGPRNIATLDHVTFTGNKHFIEGTLFTDGYGVFSVNGSTAEVTIKNSSFTDNTTINGTVYLYDFKSVTIDNTTITGNTATSNGKVVSGGLYVYQTDGTVNLTSNTHIYNNTAPNATVKALSDSAAAEIGIMSGGANSYANAKDIHATVTIDDSVKIFIDENGTTYTLTEYDGTGLKSYSSKKYYWHTGYYSIKEEPVTVYVGQKTDFDREKEYVTPSLTEAVSYATAHNTNTIYILDEVIINEDNVNEMSTALNSGITFARSAESPNGNMFSIQGVDIVLSNAKIDGMNLASDSAMIRVSGFGHLTISDETVIENGKNTSGNGGGIYLSQSSLTMNGGTITGNTASSFGGGIYAYGGGSSCVIAFEGGVISKNKAYSGAGVYTGAASTAFGKTGNRTEFLKNSTTGGLGGGVYLENAGAKVTHEIFKALFTGNESNRDGQYFDGGAIYINKGTTVNMKNVYVSGNKDSDTAHNNYCAVCLCPDGELAIYDLEGLLSVNNGKNPDIGVVQGGVYGNDHQDPQVYLAKFAPSGGDVSYRYTNGTELTDPFIRGYFRVFTHAADETISTSYEAAEKNGVVITGNYAKQFGSGIMCNGILKIGTETKSLRVSKVWEDENSPHEDDQILVYLTRNGEIVSEDFRSDSHVVLNKDNNWSYLWTNLGDEFEWGVVEAAVPGYKSEVKVEKDTEFAKITDKYYIATITNTPNPDDESASLTVQKTAYGLDENAEYTFTVELTFPENSAEGAYAVNVAGKLLPIYGNKVTFNMKAKEEAIIAGLPVGTTYKVTEGSGNYTTYTAGTVGLLEESEEATATIVNVSKIDIPVEKNWTKEEDNFDLRPEKITVYLTGNNGEQRVAELNATNEWKHTFNELPEYDAAGNKIAYTVSEVGAENYKADVTTSENGIRITNSLKRGSLKITKVVNGNYPGAASKEYVFDVTGPYDYSAVVRITGSSSFTLGNLIPGEYTIKEKDSSVDGYKLSVSGGGTATVTVQAESDAEAVITNTYTAITSLTVNKEWVNNDGTKIAPAGASITVELTQNGKDTGTTATLSEENGWTHTFEGLEKLDADGNAYEYNVKELTYSGYTHSITTNADGSITITNTQIKLTDIPVTKKWTNLTGEAIDAPADAQITVTLYCNGEAIKTATLNAANELILAQSVGLYDCAIPCF